MEKSRYFMTMQSWSLKQIGRPPSWMFKILFTVGALDRRVLYLHAKFCCKDIAIFRVFSET